jgi:hypothetical protein
MSRTQRALLIAITIGAASQLITVWTGGTIDRWVITSDCALLLTGGIIALWPDRWRR